MEKVGCSGHGTVINTCSDCFGEYIEYNWTTCGNCDGEGHYQDGFDNCSHCQGVGSVTEICEECDGKGGFTEYCNGCAGSGVRDF